MCNLELKYSFLSLFFSSFLNTVICLSSYFMTLSCCKTPLPSWFHRVNWNSMKWHFQVRFLFFSLFVFKVKKKKKKKLENLTLCSRALKKCSYWCQPAHCLKIMICSWPNIQIVLRPQGVLHRPLSYTFVVSVDFSLVTETSSRAIHKGIKLRHISHLTTWKFIIFTLHTEEEAHIKFLVIWNSTNCRL